MQRQHLHLRPWSISPRRVVCPRKLSFFLERSIVKISARQFIDDEWIIERTYLQIVEFQLLNYRIILY